MNARRLSSVLFFLIAFGATAVPAGGQTLLDAEKAARLAIEASTLTAAAVERLNAAEYAIKEADGARLPVISVNAAIARQNGVPEFSVPSDQPGQPPLVLYPNIENTYSADLTLTQPIYTGGAITANRDAARMDESAATWSQSLTALELGYAARIQYWNAVGASAGVAVAEAQLNRTRRLLDDTRALREAGMAVNADVFAAEARVAAAEVDVIRTRNEEEKTLARLRSLLGMDDGAAVTLADAATDRVPDRPPSLAGLQQQSLERRPELKMTDARIEALGARARVVDAARLPAVGATGQYVVARPNQRYFPLVDEANDSWRVGVVASWKVFDGSQTKARAAGVEAEQRALQQDRGEMERKIRLEVETTRLELESALEAVSAADASATAAAAWEEASSERYAAGLALLSELLDAQADLTAAEAAQVRTRVAAWLANATLHRAIGR
jgi:outer membrane protein TolC